MSILDNVSHSSVATGLRIVVSGVEGVGKTTFACNAPDVLLVPLEAGFAGVSVSKVPMLEEFEHVMMLLEEIYEKRKLGQFQYKSIVFDSATALERMIHQAVLRSDPTYAVGNKKAMTMESALGGYGKAYTYANELFEKFIKQCDILAVWGGINIILTCHVFAARVVDPTAGEYDTWDLLLHSPKNQKTYGKREMLTQWADVVGFLHEPIFVTEADGKKGQSMNRGVSANQGRVLAVTRTPGYVAKNRFGLTNTISVPKVNSWNALAQEIYQSSGVDCYNRNVV